MSSQSPQSPDLARLEALGKEIAALEGRTDALIAILRSGARVRQVLFFFAVIVLALFIGWLYFTGRRIKQDPKPIANAALDSVLANQQELEREARTLFNDAWPVLRKALEDQFQKDMPKFTDELNKQWQLMQASLSEKLDDFIQKQYEEAIKKHQQVLLDKFPEIKDEKTKADMIAHLQMAMEPMVKKYYGKRLMNELDEISRTIQRFPRSTAKGDIDTLADQLYDKLWELFMTKVSVLAEPPKRAGRSGG